MEPGCLQKLKCLQTSVSFMWSRIVQRIHFFNPSRYRRVQQSYRIAGKLTIVWKMKKTFIFQSITAYTLKDSETGAHTNSIEGSRNSIKKSLHGTCRYEVKKVVNKLNNNSLAGPDGIKVELLNTKEPKLIKEIHAIITSFWTMEKTPIKWEAGSICPIYKKRDKLDYDTAILSRHYDPNTLIKNLNNHLAHLEKWFSVWKIALNTSKTEAVSFSQKRPPPEITLQNQRIPWSQHTKYLGVIIDKNLSFRQHITQIRNKFKNASRKLYPLIGRKSKLNRHNKMLIYTLILKPLLTYASPIWAHAARTNINFIESSQNAILRQILDAHCWNEKENGDCKTELAAGTIVELKQEPALITDPNSDVGAVAPQMGVPYVIVGRKICLYSSDWLPVLAKVLYPIIRTPGSANNIAFIHPTTHIPTS
ncbi:RNA-directed DNA polymerase from mobile element jockey [Trichonephila clavipes]|nr:RNA-directed DNA polymerase from mobile element jockey [Trichonephila clavipes]